MGPTVEPALLVETTRLTRVPAAPGPALPDPGTQTGQVVESRHYGHLVVVEPDGDVAASLGDPHHRTFVRSAAKPFQAAASIELARQDLPSDLIAVGWSSHRGEAPHLRAVASLLERVGLTPQDLTTPPAVTDLDSGEAPRRIAHNCSGKHALFALAGRAVACPRQRLLDPEGPVQVHVLAVLADALDTAPFVGVDGCGAPAVVASLDDLARAYARLARPDGRWRHVAAAGLTHPLLVGGTGRLETALLAAGVVAKPGAEGVFAAGWTDRRGRAWGAALKISDGASRASSTAIHGLLSAAGVVDSVVWQPPPVLGGGRPAGSVRASHAVLHAGGTITTESRRDLTATQGDNPLAGNVGPV